MAKYSPELKAEIISKYNQGMATSIQLAREYNLNSGIIRSWIQTYRLQGKIRRSRNKRIFDTDFKLAVIDYYQTHEVTIAEVAARFDLLPGQVSHWRTLFKTGGIEALRPHQKRRKPKQMKSPKHPEKKPTSSELSENERLKAEIIKLKKELYDARLDAAILKKAAALFWNSKHDGKR